MCRYIINGIISIDYDFGYFGLNLANSIVFWFLPNAVHPISEVISMGWYFCHFGYHSAYVTHFGS